MLAALEKVLHDYQSVGGPKSIVEMVEAALEAAR